VDPEQGLAVAVQQVGEVAVDVDKLPALDDTHPDEVLFDESLVHREGVSELPLCAVPLDHVVDTVREYLVLSGPALLSHVVRDTGGDGLTREHFVACAGEQYERHVGKLLADELQNPESVGGWHLVVRHHTVEPLVSQTGQRLDGALLRGDG
jgi:hypothetical protein